MEKKYYNIGEVSEILNLPKHRLRYLDKALGSDITKIRGRRYYKSEDIKLIKQITDSKIHSSPIYDLSTIDSILISLKRMKSVLGELSDMSY